MSLRTKTRKLLLVAFNPHIVACRTDYLFILSHMRSRSSVLSHVLGSNPEICGYGELHRPYTGPLDLFKMRAELYEEARCRLSNKYLLDKLLYNRQLISDDVFDIAKPRVIFLLREPTSTIKSIIDMGHRTGVAWYRDPEQAANYYCSRLYGLEEYARKTPGDYVFVDADDLVDDTDNVLTRLTEWLRLKEPLDKNYSSFRNTGKSGYGDSSENIISGFIRKTEGHPTISVPPAILQRAEASYRHCKQRLLARQAMLCLENQTT